MPDHVDDDLDLLRLELDAIWGVDEHGRLRGAHHLVIAAAPGQTMAAVAEHVSDELMSRLIEVVDNAGPRDDPAIVPAAVERCCELLQDSFGAVTVAGGPSYAVVPPLSATTEAALVRSDTPEWAGAAGIRPQSWQAGEWSELISGRAGAPWAMVIADEQVASICHTPARSDIGAEAGTWTDPGFRGRGYAAAATAAWADLAARRWEHLYYSTDAANPSSRRVAARLGLRPIGWLWKITPAC